MKKTVVWMGRMNGSGDVEDNDGGYNGSNGDDVNDAKRWVVVTKKMAVRMERMIVIMEWVVVVMK